MCRAANEKIVKGSMAMRTHHDEIGGEFLRLFDDMLDGRAVELHRFGGNALLLQQILESREMFGGGFFTGGRDLGDVFH